MIKDILLVGIGSFVGGSLRMVISKYVQLTVAGSFPLGTMVVNVLGCFLIGIFSSLTNDHGTLLKGGDGFMISSLYIIASLALGFIALLAGRHLVMSFQ